MRKTTDHPILFSAHPVSWKCQPQKARREAIFPLHLVILGLADIKLKWSGKFGQRAKMYPTRLNGYKNDKATEFFRQV